MGRTFLKLPKEFGQRSWAHIVCKIIELDDNKEKIKFLVKLPKEDQDKILVHNEIIDIIANQYDEELQDKDRKWMFRGITAHEGLLSPKHHYNGSKYNMLVQWEDGSITCEPLNILGKMIRYPVCSTQWITTC